MTCLAKRNYPLLQAFTHYELYALIPKYFNEDEEYDGKLKHREDSLNVDYDEMEDDEDEVDVYLGAHADDAAGNAYADCSEAFTDAIGKAIHIGTYNKVNLVAPLVNMNKAEVVKTGLELGTPYELTWSCYKGGEKPCGKCGTCIDRAKAFAANGVKDPALKED